MMKRVTRYRLWIWRVLWVLVHWVRPLICRIRIEGTEYVSAVGGGVVACNHTLGVDWIALGYASPRELYYMAKAEAFQISRFTTWILHQGGVFPVQRTRHDIVALQNAIDLARAGKLIGMFPEGTRSQTGALRRAKTGAARIAMEANVPVIPAAVINGPALLTSWKRLIRPLITVRFGPPLRRMLQPGEDANQAAREFTDTIMAGIAGLLPPELRGVYAHPPAETAPSAAEPRTVAVETEPSNEHAEGV